MSSSLTLQDIARPWLERPYAYSLDLRFGECGIHVVCNNAALIQELEDYFKDFHGDAGADPITIHVFQNRNAQLELDYTIKQPDPGKTKIKEEYVELEDGRIVRKRLTGMLFFMGDELNLAVGPCHENSNQVINFINNRFIQWTLHRGALLFHAAAVTHNDKGVAMAGFSGAGKSTLSLHLMRRGTTFVSNDRLMVYKTPESKLEMLGVAKLPRINPGTALSIPELTQIMDDDEVEEFTRLPDDELWDLEHKYDVFLDEVFGEGRFEIHSPMQVLVLLNWDRTSEAATEMTRVDLARRPDLLPAFTKATGLFYRTPIEGRLPDPPDEAYVELLKDCDVYEVTGAVDFDLVADQCIGLL